VRDGAIWMGVGGVGGAVLGALAALRIPAHLLARAFAIVLILNAVVLVRRVMTQAKPESSTPE